MRPEEFHALARVEREHWFYRGKRAIVRHWLRALRPLAADDLLVDVGAGTGQFLIELAGSCQALGIEPDRVGLQIASGTKARLVRGSIAALPVASGRAAAVTALDVLEHVEDEGAALRELVRITRPTGLVALHVPAFPALWSDWDVALGHRRRYTLPELHRLVEGAGLAIRRCVYVNSAAFLPILLYRRLRTRRRPGAAERLEDHVPPAALNALLYALFVVPARWRWFAPPVGVSILCIAEKPVPMR